MRKKRGFLPLAVFWLTVWIMVCLTGCMVSNENANITGPEAFFLYSPANGVQIDANALYLMWNPSINADKYEVYLSPAQDFHSQPTETTAPVLWVSGLAQGQTYYWKVVAKNSLGQKTSNSGILWSFSVKPADIPPSAPGSFVLLTPLNDAQDMSVNPTLLWSSSEGADFYSVWFGSQLPISQTQIVYEPSYAPGPLEEATTYYWTVTAHNAYGDTPAQGDPYWSFTTETAPLPPGPPDPFSMLLPANGALDVDLEGILLWEESAGATSYDLYLHTQPDFSTIVPTQTSNTQFSTGPLLPNTTYYWTVCAKNAFGTTEAGNGAIWSFTTLDWNDETPPQPFFLLSPADGLVDHPLDPIFYWTKSRYAVQYTLFFRSVSHPQWTEIPTPLTYLRLYDLTPETDYEWRVRAVNDWGAVEGSDGAIWSFRTRAEEVDLFPDISGDWTVYIDTNLIGGLVFGLFVEQEGNQLQTTLTVEGIAITLFGSIDTQGTLTMTGSDDALGTITFSGALVQSDQMEGTVSGEILGNAVTGTWYAVR